MFHFFHNNYKTSDILRLHFSSYIHSVKSGGIVLSTLVCHPLSRWFNSHFERQLINCRLIR